MQRPVWLTRRGVPSLRRESIARDLPKECLANRGGFSSRLQSTIVAVGVLSVGLLCGGRLDAQSEIRYELSLERRVHHEAKVSIRYDALSNRTLELRMSRSSPGRYALHEFAKNVYDVRATNGAGESLAMTRPNPHQWNVSGHDGTVLVSYTIFGDRADGTYMAVDETHGHFNAPATFMWARGLDERPISLVITDAPEDWIVATQLAPTNDRRRFTAPNLAYFLDSPVEVARLTLLEWEAGPPEATQTIRLALHHLGTREQAEAYKKMAQAVVLEQEAIFGELPSFDFGTYTFLADYLPWVSGDGMEHRNSTVLSSTRGLDTPDRVVGTLSHEFFHAWNVERIRPASLEPFDFEEANMSDALWFAEGFTSYYDDLTLKRASLLELEDYVAQLGANLSSVVNAPGRKHFSPVEMSMQAPFVDAATSVDPTNRDNTFVSYYSYGAVVALGLDLSIRRRFGGKSLDDVMRLMWHRHGRTERPFEILEIRTAVADVVGDPEFARDFFDRYILDSDLPDFGLLLRSAGIELTPSNPGRVWLGASFEGGTLVVRGGTVAGSPAHRAGINRGDRILSLGGQNLESIDELRAILNAAKPGESTSVTFQQRGETTRGQIVWTQDPRFELRTFESLNQPVPEPARQFRSDWLGSKVGGRR